MEELETSEGAPEAILVGDLAKSYRGLPALDGISFGVAAGEVCGLIGPNGAGKTTLLRILATVLRPSRGTVRIAGFELPADVLEVRHRIGYMPDRFATYEELRVDAFLEFFAHVYRLPRDGIARTLSDILELVDLLPLRHAPIEELSLGVRQRLSLARALIHNPQVLLLDEPVSGLDPRARVEMRALLRELGRMGKAVLISSHVLGDLADLCDRMIVLERGEMQFSGTFEELRTRVAGPRRVRLGVAETDGAGDAELAALIRSQRWALEVEPSAGGRIEIALADGADAALLSRLVAEHGRTVTHLAEVELDLEEAFLRLTRGIVS